MMTQEGKKGCGLALAILCVGIALGFVAGLLYFGRQVPFEAAQPQAVTARQALVVVNATGDAGLAGGTGYSDEMVRGEVIAVYLDYTSGISTTTDLTLRGKNAPYDTILSLSDFYTDTWIYPWHKVQDNTNTDVTFDGTRPVYTPFVVDDFVTAVITQSTWTTPTLKLYIYWK